MSLSGIKNRRQPTTFGKDLNVLIGDTTINGDLTILGNINGTSSQGQNTNNTWTGTNDFSVYRPTCLVDAVGVDDAVRYTQLQTEIINNSVINSGGDFTGTNAFTQPITTNTITPVGATEAISGSYLVSSWNAKGQSYLNTNNTWTGASNTFQNFLPTAIEPLANTDVATKNYTDTQANTTAIGDSTSIASQISQTYDFASYKAVEIQIIGGGGGSTSSVGTCVCSSAGVAGGSGSQASIIVLTNSSLVGGANLATFTFSVGGGGRAGIGCGTQSASGGGGATNLSYFPKSGVGLPTTNIDINILRANGGGGFGGTCGQAGSSSGGTYSNINQQISLTPYTSSNGIGGSQCKPSISQPYGYSNYGWSGSATTCQNGLAGQSGGYVLTYYNNF
jgi:hypothetical protein